MVVGDVFVWIHVLCMLGAFGGLLLVQVGLPRAVRDDAETARAAGRLPTILLAMGFLAGLMTYVMNIRYAANYGSKLPAPEHAIVGIKFLLMVAAGAFMGLTSRVLKDGAAQKAVLPRTLAILALALAAFLGVML